MEISVLRLVAVKPKCRTKQYLLTQIGTQPLTAVCGHACQNDFRLFLVWLLPIIVFTVVIRVYLIQPAQFDQDSPVRIAVTNIIRNRLGPFRSILRSVALVALVAACFSALEASVTLKKRTRAKRCEPSPNFESLLSS